MAAKPATNKKKNNWPKILFETEYFTFEKAGPGQIRTEDLCRPRHIRCLQAKMAGNALKFEFLMSHDTSDSVKQVINPKKSIFQFDNANHKRNNDRYSIALLAQNFQTGFSQYCDNFLGNF